MKQKHPEAGEAPGIPAPRPGHNFPERGVPAPGEALRPCDTVPEADAYLVEGYRRMSSAERMERVRALNHAVLSLAEADVRRRHPDADRREIALRVAARWLDAETMRRAFGWEPAENRR